MIITPPNHPVDWKQPPRLAIGISLVLTLIFVLWNLTDIKREQALDELYQAQLLPIEWELYETHAGRSGQTAILPSLKTAYAHDDIRPIRRYIGGDDAFVLDMRTHGKSYMTDEQFGKWQTAREQFDAERSKLGSQALGINPDQFRPITFLTFSMTQPDQVQLIGTLFFLLGTGLAIELALGSGALLAAWFGGGIIGGLVYLLANGKGALPLSGGGAAAASVAGVFLMHFRLTSTRWFGSLNIPAIVILPIWLAFLAAGFFASALRAPELLAQVGGFVSAPLWYFAYSRWFAHDEAPEEEPEAEDAGDAYRQHLHLALDAIGRMEFVEGRQRLREMIKAYPNDLQILSQLFKLEKLNPENNTFDAVARRIFTLGNTSDGAALALSTYREYEKLSPEKRALDSETCLKLVMRFARLGEMKDSERLMKQVIDRKTDHFLIPKAALAMAQAYEKLDSPNNAERYREMAATR